MEKNFNTTSNNRFKNEKIQRLIHPNKSLKKFQQAIIVDVETKRINEVIEKKNVIFQKSSDKFKNYIESIKKNSLNIDTAYEKRKELNKILFRKLLPLGLNLEDDTYPLNNLNTEKSLTNRKIEQKDYLKQTMLSSFNFSKGSFDKIKIKNAKNEAFLSSTIHPNFHNYVQNLRKKVNFQVKFFINQRGELTIY